jgi:hypothetical protein
MRVELLKPELTAAYERYLVNHNNSLLYYSSKYKDFLKDLLGCKEHYLVCLNGQDICGILPLMSIQINGAKVYNSLPYYGSNGGVIADNPDACWKLMDAYNDIACSRGTISSTLVGNPFMCQDASNIHHNYMDYRIGQFTDISCGEDHWEELMYRIDSSARRNVKKAIREGVDVEIDNSRMDTLRDIHRENMQAVGGIPKSHKFFDLVPQHFTQGLDYNIYVAKLDGSVIAVLLIFYFNRTVEYYTPAVDSEYRSTQALPLIIMTAMVDASRRGFTWWNWGGTWKSQTGVYRFKRKWAAKEKNYYYYTQLNDKGILDWSQSQILGTFPSFFVIPFSELRSGGMDG